MISAPTTFIVGAGASVPYGMLVGSTLLKLARKAENSPIRGLLYGSEEAKGGNDAFFAEVRNQVADSIDEVLEVRRDFAALVHAGKVVIAALMAQSLLRRPTGDIERDWLRYIILRMRAGALSWEEFLGANARVRFLTFNFDTFIEDRLSATLASIYGVERSQVRSAFPVMHVHGVLPELPVTGGRDSFEDPRLPGIPSGIWMRWVESAANSIKLVSDEVDQDLLETARETIKQSRVVCFLGFGFHATNVQRLALQKVLKDDSFQHVYGSAHGLKEGERTRIKRELNGRIDLGGEKDDCLEVLRNKDVFQS